MLERERATSMGLSGGRPGHQGLSQEAFDIAIGVSDPIWQIWRMSSRPLTQRLSRHGT
jgi:hypothetical protein